MRLLSLMIASIAFFFSSAVLAANVAIVQGDFYTPNLKNQLQAAGHTVTELTTYDASSLAPYSLVVHYGNSFTETTALEAYVQAGGKLLLTPWAGNNFSVPTNIRSIADGSCSAYNDPSPGITILAPGDALLSGVTPPLAAAAVNIGRICAPAPFEAGATQVLKWNDDVAMLGYRSYGSGIAYQLNMHIVTSDTAYQVIDQAWAAQIVLNMIAPTAATAPTSIPTLSEWGMIVMSGLIVLATFVTLRRRNA